MKFNKNFLKYVEKDVMSRITPEWVGREKYSQNDKIEKQLMPTRYSSKIIL